MNTYGYVDADPLGFIDPLGLSPGDTFDSIDATIADANSYMNQMRGDQSIIESLLYGFPYSYVIEDASDENSCSNNQYTYSVESVAMGMVPSPKGFADKGDGGIKI